MDQKIVTFIYRIGEEHDIQSDINSLVIDGWLVKQISTACYADTEYSQRGGYTQNFICFTLLLERL